MVANPFLLKILQGGLEVTRAGAGALPYLLPSEAEKANREALEQLKQASKTGDLGLSTKESEAMYAQGLGSLDKQLAQNEALLRQLGGVTATSGQAAKQAAQIAAESAKAQMGINLAVQQADIKAAESQRQELAARQQAADVAKQNKVAALAAAPTALLDFLQGSTAVDATVFGTETKEQKIDRLEEELVANGLTVDQAAQIAERYKNDPKGMEAAVAALSGKGGKK